MYSNGNQFYGGLALSGLTAGTGNYIIIKIVDGGFEVSHCASASSTIESGKTYRYFAIG